VTCSLRTCVDAGGGWLIFALPPAELAVHPSEASRHAIYLVGDDLNATGAALEAKGVRPAGPITEQAGSRLTAGALPDASEIALYAATHPGQARRSNGASRHPRHGGERGATGMDPAPYVERVAGGGPFVGVKCTVRKGGRVWPSGLSGPCGSDHQPGHDGTASREAGQRYRRGTGRGERSQADTFQLTVSIDRGGSAAPRVVPA